MEKCIKTKLEKASNSGITLIALVITIVILIILATITLSFAFGDNGLVDMAEQAKDMQENRAKYEEESFQNVDIYINELIDGAGGGTPPKIPETVEEAKEEGTKFPDNTEITDVDDEPIWVPEGFEIDPNSPIDIDEGIVITDGTNEFVWVPVGEEDLGDMYIEAPGTKLMGVNVTTNIYSNLRFREDDGFGGDAPGIMGSREPDVLSTNDVDEKNYKEVLGYANLEAMAQDFVDQYTAVYNCIKEKGGFYVGRYELTGTMDKPTVQRNQKILATDVTNGWYGLKKACDNVVNTDNVKTTMIYGNLWDEIMDWLIETGDKTDYQINVTSADWGNYSDSTGEADMDPVGQKNSGANEAWKANNIYDLAGNYNEWTQEAEAAHQRTQRGGTAFTSGATYSASDRRAEATTSAYSDCTSRVILYME